MSESGHNKMTAVDACFVLIRVISAQFQSFSKAAESLGYSQSAVTVQIKALEEELEE